MLAGLFCLLSSVALAQSATSQGMAEQRAVSVTQVALGILSYARWPQEQAQLRLCIVGPTEYTDDLVKGTTQASGRTVIVRRLLADNLAIASDCDAAYSGKLTGDERSRLSASLNGHPVLSISEYGVKHERYQGSRA